MQPWHYQRNNSPFREERQETYWPEQATETGWSYDQRPPANTVSPWSHEYSALHQELSANVQRVFGTFEQDSSHPVPSEPPEHAEFPRYKDLWTTDPPREWSENAVSTEDAFLSSFRKGKGTLTFQGQNSNVLSIHQLSVDIIAKACPILGMSFEESRSGPTLHLEVVTERTAYPLLRYLYTGSYALAAKRDGTGDIFEEVPTSLLFHCQMYKLGEIFDLPNLRTQAYVNVLRQCEFACSSPEKPIELCAAIEYLYAELRNHEQLIDAVHNYCVSCFVTHKLGQDQEFKQLAYDLRPFHQDLCKTVMARGFENEAALAIIQMPFKAYVPETYSSRVDIDDVYHFHGVLDVHDMHRPARTQDTTKTLTFRPKPAGNSEVEMTEAVSVTDPDIETEPPRILRVVNVAEDYSQDSEPKSAQECNPGAPKNEPTASPGFDFQFVSESAHTEESSGSDSEGGFVRVKWADESGTSGHDDGPGRQVASSASAGVVEHGHDSDSDWSIV